MDLSPSLLASLKRLRLLHELSPNQVRRVLAICRQRIMPAGEVLCRAGAESDRLYVVLSGTIQVLSPRGVELARESAVTTTGETGVLSGEVRCATVRAVDEVVALEMDRLSLVRLMQDDGSLAVRLYRNAMVLVREKLMAADCRLEEALARLEAAGDGDGG